MSIISKLRPLFRPTNRLFYQPKRNGGGHGGNIEIRHTNITDQITYDTLHFYTFLGVIPLLLFGGYMSLFVGDAILQDIPEGYQPEDWECERNPVRRLLAKYIFKDAVYMHEWRVASIAAEQDSRMVKYAIDEVKRQQAKYRDYQAWYFEPTELASFDRMDQYERDKKEHYQNRDSYGL